MKILILGGKGMLGHKLFQVFQDKFETFVTIRKNFNDVEALGLFSKDQVFENVNAQDFPSMSYVIQTLKPDVVVNAIGVIKQKSDSRDIRNNIEINSLLPHKVSQITSEIGARFITFSTDCVFDGKKGNYVETDISNALDIYGKTKYLGEVSRENCLTFRTSIIGREISSNKSLVEWFLSQNGGSVKGFTNAIYNGFPTVVVAGIVADIIENEKDLEGLYHLSSDPINKFDLLHLIKAKLNLDIAIERFEDFSIDRSLNSETLREQIGFEPVNWKVMVDKMFDDKSPYDLWRNELN